ncbi:Uncharacterized protein BP5553_03511 [Venustampulla echinocandica]|uniref:Nudix hydrolase domain-containing protein n=1 Tax=Venustampulla echinocandica TaxID=2656787 RepID=A0A370TUG6_9HELO|nr:Uncharacterized protein BP5553_03511 [Venustampulla echinocandica]RDL39171.1 Uncharacterized protein BP5553_03511 [Venustampulla echinocandica]
MPRDLPSNLSAPFVPPSLAHHSITLANWSITTHARLVVGALVFRRHAPSCPPQILLVKRASTDSFPNFWEVPGGSVDSSDKTLLDAVVREVWEETGLLVKGFVQQVWDANEGSIEVEFLGRRGERWCKLNFIVEVEDGEVTLDAEEHQDWGWFEKGEIEGLDFVSKQGIEIVMNGFRAFEARK